MIGLVIGLAVVLVIGLCGCAVVAGILTAAAEDRSTAQDPWYGGPYAPDGEDEAVPSPPPEPTRSPAIRPSGAPGRVSVTYEVTGQGPVDVEFYDSDGDLIQTDDVRLPWRKTFRMTDASRVMVLATSRNRQHRVDCGITVDGRSVAEDGSWWWVNCTG
ncbi:MULTISPECIES: MmpS family transport accessory protein [unclassified Micromonospora]|uniref:MmpS family transport accessory protein n=1 Tax=unclassified Micromonospora TaxID=2617518 RepID=UPI003640D480